MAMIAAVSVWMGEGQMKIGAVERGLISTNVIHDMAYAAGMVREGQKVNVEVNGGSLRRLRDLVLGPEPGEMRREGAAQGKAGE